MAHRSNITVGGAVQLLIEPAKVWAITVTNTTAVDLCICAFDRIGTPKDGEPLYDVEGRVQFGVASAGGSLSLRFGADSGEPWDCRQGLVVALSATDDKEPLPLFTIAQDGVEDSQVAVGIEYELPAPGESLSLEAERGEFIGRRVRRNPGRR